MKRLAFLIDFGSTFTKVTAVDLDEARLVGRGQVPSTVLTDVRDGLLHALVILHERHCVFDRSPADLSVLEGANMVLASSSAAGGLKMAVIGLVPGLTVEAAKNAALGAGAKIVGSWSFKLTENAIAEIEAQRPDIILLTGGIDGGDVSTILHNARLLARSRLTVPILAAGNQAVATEVAAILLNGAKEVRQASNVMPQTGQMAVGSAREEIRKLFIERITQAKGLDSLGGLVPVVLPTPMAVLQGALLGARGAGEEEGWGDLLVVDVGGATTDVHSIGEGTPTGPHFADRGLPEPYAKRTVEGDLGIRFNAATLTERIGAPRFEREFRREFPEFAVSSRDITDYINGLGIETSRTPTHAWQSAVDAQLARAAVDFAVERHVGKRERIVTREGDAWMHYGKDLSDTRTLIGTGGVFTYNPYAAHILSGTRADNGSYEVLRPRSAELFIDSSYLLYAIGLLAEKRSDVAFRIFKQSMEPVVTSSFRDESRID